MTRRKRGTRPDSMTTEQQPRQAKTYMGLPRTEIEEAAKIYVDTIPVKLHRRNSLNGRFAHLGMYHFKVAELIDIEEFLKDKFGGGAFMVFACHPNNHFSRADPIPTFQIDIEAPPKASTAADLGVKPGVIGNPVTNNLLKGDESMAPVAAVSDVPITAEELADVPHWVQGLSLQDKIAFVHDRRAKRAHLMQIMGPNGLPANAQPQVVQDPSMAKHADYIAQALAEERAKAAEREAKLQARLEEQERRLEQDRIERQRIEAEARERAFKVEMEALRAQIAQLQSKPPEKPSPLFTPEMLGITVPAAVTLITAMMNNSTQRSSALVEQQTRSFQTHMDAMNSLLKKDGAAGDSTKTLIDGVVKLFPAVAPLLTTFLDSKSPKAQAQLYSDMIDNHLNSMTMIASLTEQLAKSGGQDPWYLPVVQNGIQSVIQLTESLAKAQRAQMPVPQGQNQAQQGQATQQQQQPQQMTQGQQVARMIFAQPGFPADMKKEEWFHVLALLHDHHDAQQTAEFIVRVLNTMIENDTLPATIMQAGFETDPTKALASIIAVLPVSQNKQYVDEVLRNVHELLMSEESEETEEEEEEEDSEVSEDDENEEEHVNGVQNLKPPTMTPREENVIDTDGSDVLPFSIGNFQYDEFVKKSANGRQQVTR